MNNLQLEDPLFEKQVLTGNWFALRKQSSTKFTYTYCTSIFIRFVDNYNKKRQKGECSITIIVGKYYDTLRDVEIKQA